MAKATKKAAGKKGSATKGITRKAASKKSPAKKTVSKKSVPEKGGTKKNKLGVKNSLVNNINAHKERGDSKSKKKTTVDEKQYDKMEANWGKKK